MLQAINVSLNTSNTQSLGSPVITGFPGIIYIRWIKYGIMKIREVFYEEMV